MPGYILMGTLWTGAHGHTLYPNLPALQPCPLFLGVMARAGAVIPVGSGMFIFVTVPRNLQGIFIPPLVNSTLPLKGLIYKINELLNSLGYSIITSLNKITF